MTKYLSPDQMVELVPGTTKGSWSQLRFSGKGPRYRKVGKKVIYVEAEVIDWIEGTARFGTAHEAV